MVAVANKLLLYCSLVALLSSTTSSLFESLITDSDPCEDVCLKTYPSNTYKSVFGECCRRGCRLYSIIELVDEQDGTNGTIQSCYENCKMAYPSEREDTTACLLGCRSQKPFTDRKEQISDVDSSIPDVDMSRLLYPMLYMHNMYSNMVDKVTSQMCVSWSFFMQDGAGRLVVIKSQPQIVNMDVQDFDDYSTYRGTSSVIETNIEPSDNTATEVQRHSQLKSARSIGDEAESWRYKLNDGSNNDWLTCIARKTGVPRLLLCIIILLSAVAMIWLCMSAAVTAPEQRLSQKLSISGDLDYLRYLPEKKGIQSILPQDFVQARPLPVKIRVEQI